MQKNDTKPYSLWDIPLALVLLTRLPVPRLPEPVFARQAQAAWAFPVVGLVVGGVACLVGWLAMVINLPLFVAATLLVATLIMMTGAMHEDGLADTFDGFWGGFTPERRLEIMKDSHIGTYGVLALMISQVLRVSAVAALLATGSIWAILAACVFSRALMPVLMASLPRARKSGLSHSVGTPGTISVGVSVGMAILIAVFLCGSPAVGAIIFATLIIVVLAAVARKKIGGQTGDILGASQQLAEIAFLLALSAQI
ncbi:adenosylcobinamide-GDP ribazoletransferase [uncultured Ruegeria sp.]|uniref:adenosylcobinamide-GDP ribazoletransferase n=1 Tax=uncultured Ruegeria sp. TaxID=259304 RepID=UPI0026277600|nr:adenosylcobinamide-GDP ribazoletransferase [uncultured Ruegeria sp.]